MRKKVKISLALVLLCIFCLSGWSFLTRYMEYRRGEQLYSDAADRFIIPLPEEPSDSSDQPTEGEEPQSPGGQTGGQAVPAVTMDFDALAEINSDIIGWISIPDTNINYPLLKGQSKDDYLRRAYNKQPNRMGSIFMDFRCSADLNDRHTIIYGHNMRNSTMLSRLLNYADQSFYDKHPYFYIYTPEGRLTYQIFSAYMETLPSDSYTIGFKTDSGFGEFVSGLTAKTVVATNLFPGGGEKVVTLSTCSSVDADKQRFIVHGYLTEDTRPGDEAGASGAPQP